MLGLGWFPVPVPLPPPLPHPPRRALSLLGGDGVGVGLCPVNFRCLASPGFLILLLPQSRVPWAASGLLLVYPRDFFCSRQAIMTLILFVPFLPGITVTEAQRLASYCFSPISNCVRREGKSVCIRPAGRKSSSLASHPRRILTTATFCPLMMFFKTVFPTGRW